MIARSISIDKAVNNLSLESQLIYTWCIPYLDDFGLMTNDPGDIKYLVLPRNQYITEKHVHQFIEDALKVGLIEMLDDCIHFPGFTKHNPLTEYKKSKSEFRENRYNKGKSKYSPEFPSNPPENSPKDKVSKDNNTVAPATVEIKGEKYMADELSYVPEESTKKSTLGKKTMAVLAYAYLAAKGITLSAGENYDANKIAKGLSKLYRETNKDPNETIRRIKLGSEYFKQRGLDWTPEAVWRRWEDIAKWVQDGRPGSRPQDNPSPAQEVSDRRKL